MSEGGEGGEDNQQHRCQSKQLAGVNEWAASQQSGSRRLLIRFGKLEFAGYVDIRTRQIVGYVGAQVPIQMHL